MAHSETTPKELAHYLADLDAVEGASAPGWLKALREQGRARFVDAPLPHRKMEEWRFTNVNPIVRTEFASALEPTRAPVDATSFLLGDGASTELVFVDGFYRADLSKRVEAEGVTVMSLAEAVAQDHAIARDRLNGVLNGSANAFTHLNTAFLLDGAVVHIAKDRRSESPIHLVYLTTEGDTPKATYPRNLVVADRHAEASVIETYAGLGGNTYFNNAVTEYVLEEGAQVTRYKVIQESPAAYHLATTSAHLDRSSALKSFSFFLSGKIARNALNVKLDGEGADAVLNGLYLAEADQLIDNATYIEHAKPHCTSYIGYKGVLADASRAVFTGKVYVQRAAQKTDSNQLNRNLLLSDRATIDTKPQLEIFADDVKCTHGATVGQHPEELIFYFRTRGIDEPMARAMLTFGFADEVVADVAVEPLRHRLDRYVFHRYSPIEG